MNIYLDTSQYAQISNLLNAKIYVDELSPEMFFKDWNKTNSFPCLSLVHLKEIAQLEDGNSRRQRVDLLEYFDGFLFSQYGWVSIIQFEIIAQILSLTGHIDETPQDWIKKKIWIKGEVTGLKSYIEENLNVLRKSRQLYKGVGEFSEIFKPMKSYLRKKLPSKVKKIKQIGTEHIEEIESFFKQSNNVDGINEGSRNIFLDELLSAVRKNNSLKKGLLSLLGVEDFQDIENEYQDDLDSLAVFCKLLLQVIPGISHATNIPKGEIEGVVKDIDYKKCYGFFLRMILHRALKYSDKKYKPGDWMDTDHIVYSPYVDILYADKTTLTFLKQELGRDSNYMSLIPNIRRTGTLKSLLKDISNYY